MSSKKNYVVINGEEEDLLNIEKTVNEYIEDGYVPLGSIVINPISGKLYQSMQLGENM
jgi:hypothetical protein